MLDRIRSTFGFDPRDVRVRYVVVFLGVVAVIVLCGGSALVISGLGQQKNINPAPVPSPTIELVPTLFLQELEVVPTETLPVPTIAPKVVSEAANTPTRSVGASCIYGEAGINDVATPIPDGGFSEFLGYVCDNGYWDIGIGDWVNSKGDWGKDGSLERAFVKFNREGVVIDRKFYDLQGNKITGPIN